MMIAMNRVELGFQPRGVLTAQIDLPADRYDDAGDRERFFEQVLAHVRATPGVSAAALASGLPTLSFGTRVHVDVAGREPGPAASEPWAQEFVASDGYADVIGLPLVRGRWFTANDTARSAPVMVVNAEMAKRYWPSIDAALGARVALPESHGYAEIVGVVGNIANADLEAAPDPSLYVPAPQAPPRSASLAIRSARPEALIPAVREAVRQVDAGIPVFQVRTLEIALADEASSTLILMSLFIAFAALALVLATTGLYGVISYSVGQRTQEIGVRLALGAMPADIRRLILRQGLALVGAAAAIGLAGAAMVARALSSILFGVTPFDPATYAGVTVVIVAAALVAMWAPAHRAMRLDPITTLKAE
jgi:predicted permease